MRIGSRVAVLAVTAGVLGPAGGCGGGGTVEQAQSGPPPEAVALLKAPEDPYRIIYTPPASLAKTVDATRRGGRPD
jgi:hypothetical protein